MKCVFLLVSLGRLYSDSPVGENDGISIQTFGSWGMTPWKVRQVGLSVQKGPSPPSKHREGISGVQDPRWSWLVQ